MKLEIELGLLREVVQTILDCDMDDSKAQEYVTKVVMDMLEPSTVVSIKSLPDSF